MNTKELIEAAKLLGAKVEPIKGHCKLQKATSQNVFDYCTKQREFGMNLGSAGGPVVVCKGHSLATGSSHKDGDVVVIEYSEPKTCPNYIEGGVIGWVIRLPKES